MVVGGPYSGGQSHQRQPLRKTWTMPLITRRSSTRALPRTSRGKCGSIRFHSRSLSQNKFLRIFKPPNHAQVNQHPIQTQRNLLGFGPSITVVILVAVQIEL
jgi:hypothetical protein